MNAIYRKTGEIKYGLYFFGHRNCYDLDKKILFDKIEELFVMGVDTFYVGNQGSFDSMVLESLLQVKKIYQQLEFSVVLAYLAKRKGLTVIHLGSETL